MNHYASSDTLEIPVHGGLDRQISALNDKIDVCSEEILALTEERDEARTQASLYSTKYITLQADHNAYNQLTSIELNELNDKLFDTEQYLMEARIDKERFSKLFEEANEVVFQQKTVIADQQKTILDLEKKNEGLEELYGTAEASSAVLSHMVKELLAKSDEQDKQTYERETAVEEFGAAVSAFISDTSVIMAEIKPRMIEIDLVVAKLAYAKCMIELVTFLNKLAEK